MPPETQSLATPPHDTAPPPNGPVSDSQIRWRGESLRRFEDDRLLRGAGRFVGDVAGPDMLHAVILRSPVASGRILRLDTQAARAQPGIAAVLTAADVAQDGLRGIPFEVCPPGQEETARRHGAAAVAEPQPLLAAMRVRYVGEPVALVVARTFAQAMDAVEVVGLEIEDDAAVADVKDALAGGMAGIATPVVFTHAIGSRAAVDACLAKAAVTVEIETHVPRLAPAPMETRGYIGRFDPASGITTLIANAGKPHPLRDTLADDVFGIEREKIRVVAPDIGGGFGGKNVAYVEAALVTWAARRLKANVRWISTRNESFLSDMQGRDHTIRARLAVDADGRFTSVDYEADVNLGAYLAPRGVTPALNALKVLTGPYRIDALHAVMRGVLTNTVPTAPYRGAGVPEAALAIERLVDMAAQKLGLDPLEIRRRNLVAPDELPWRAPTGVAFHSVDFPAQLALIEPEVFHARARRRDREGARRIGVGVAFTIEGYAPVIGEAAEMLVDRDGRIEIRIGTKSSGQSHETSYAQLAADALGVAPQDVTVVQGDTALVARGNGTGASRSLTVGGSAIIEAAQALLAAAGEIAARLLQCRPEQLSYAAGAFRVTGGAGAEVGLAAVAEAAPEGRLHVTAVFHPLHHTLPGGCHLAVVEVDTETGAVALLDYKAVHDAGVAVNPMVVAGQIHGGIAQGAGAVLMERVVYEAASGQPVAASFADYAMPRAADLPSFGVTLNGIPCASNLIGAKPAGEAGTVGATAAIANAIVDALSDLGVSHIEIPATPLSVWRALRAATAR